MASWGIKRGLNWRKWRSCERGSISPSYFLFLIACDQLDRVMGAEQAVLSRAARQRIENVFSFHDGNPQSDRPTASRQFVLDAYPCDHGIAMIQAEQHADKLITIRQHLLGIRMIACERNAFGVVI